MKKQLTFLFMFIMVFMISIQTKAGPEVLGKIGMNTFLDLNPALDSFPSQNIKVTGLLLTPDTLWLNVNQTATISVKVLPFNATNQTIGMMVQNPKIVSINPLTNQVTALSEGFTRIRYTTDDGDYIKNCIIMVSGYIDTVPPVDSNQYIPVTGIKVFPDSLWLYVNQTTSIDFNVLPLNATNQNITILNRDPDIIAFDPITKQITALKEGYASIWFTSEDGNHFNHCVIRVSGNTDTVPPFDSNQYVPVTGIQIHPDTLFLAVNEIANISINVLPLNATNQKIIGHFVDFKSGIIYNSDTKTVTALAAGIEKIQFYSEEGKYIGICTIVVTGNTDTVPPVDSNQYIPVTGIKVFPDSLWLYVNQTTSIDFNVLPLNATNQNITILNRDPDIIAFDPITKQITALKEGYASIWFTSEDGNHFNHCVIRVSGNTDTVPPFDSNQYVPVTGIQIHPDTLFLAVNEIANISINVLPLNATNQKISGHFVDFKRGIIYNSDTKTVTALAAGIEKIQFYSEEGKYIGICTIVVTGNTDTVNPVDTLSVQTLSGTIRKENNSIVSNGIVLLFSTNTSGSHLLINTTSINPDGSYSFQNVKKGSYLVQAMAFGLKDTVPTYYGNTILWNKATKIFVQNKPVANLNIQIIEIQGYHGKAKINGYIGQSNKPVKSVVSNPKGDITVLLQEKQENSVIIIATTKTDENGYYEFTDIPNGEFQIIVDIPGLGMMDMYTISATDEQSIIEGNNYEITENGIKTQKSFTGILSPETDDSKFQIYPNPTQGLLTIKNEKGTEESVEIYNNKGQLMNQYKVSGTETTLNIQDLRNGIYLLRIGNKTIKVIKQ